MWFFMYTCYFMSLVTFALLCVGFLQSFLKFYVFQANHVTFMILTSIAYLFTETLVIFFFVGTGVSIKEYMQTKRISGDYHQRSIKVKREVYPPLLLNMLFMIILFILVGAVDTYRIPALFYQIFFIGCVVHYIKMKIIENTSFGKTTQIILEMAGIKRP